MTDERPDGGVAKQAASGVVWLTLQKWVTRLWEYSPSRS